MGLLSRIKSVFLSPVNGWNLAKFLFFFGVFWNVQRWLILSTEWHTLTSLLLGWYKQGGNLRMWARQVSELGSFIPATPTTPPPAPRLFGYGCAGVKASSSVAPQIEEKDVKRSQRAWKTVDPVELEAGWAPGGAWDWLLLSWCHGFLSGFWMTQDGENKRMTVGDCRWWYDLVCWRMF